MTTRKLKPGDPIPPIVKAFDMKRRTNAQLMADVVTMGYIDLEKDWVLDCTYGTGRFWRKVRPISLTTSDLDPESPAEFHWDFTRLTPGAGRFDVTVIDGPYKLNGTSKPSGPAKLDEGYGVGDNGKMTWWERHDLIDKGIRECARVTKVGGLVMIKCQNQICLTHMRMQTTQFAATALQARCALEDILHVEGSRKQPRDGTERQSQDHVRRNYSTLLICRKG